MDKEKQPGKNFGNVHILKQNNVGEAQTEIDLKFHLLPLKCPKPFWKSDEHAPAYNMSVHMVRQHVT